MVETHVSLKQSMAGIYLHIPFCKQACHYCDFHFSTNTDLRTELVRAMAEEIRLQQAYLSGEVVETIYFGGGTPSILTGDEVGFLLKAIRVTQEVSSGAEITLEANPEDVTSEKLTDLRSAGVTRLSIGVQSFDDDVLRYFNRAHSAETATRSVEVARAAGFDNLSIDLIYAVPGMSNHAWQKNIEQAIALRTQHISAYTLTIEEKTAFGKWFKQGKLLPVDEKVAAEQVELLVTLLASSGFRQYEISNFSLPGYESRHNLAYWEGKKYLGIGPSAHSFNHVSRQHNVANNHLYVRAVMGGTVPADKETLSKEDQINEYILTTLRTSAGCDLQMLKSNFGYDVLALHSRYLEELQKQKLIILNNSQLQLTQSGRLLADKISSDLFLVA